MMCARCVSTVRTELLGDLLVRVAERQEAQHLPLAVGERILLGPGLFLGVGGDESSAERWVDVLPPAATSRTAPTTSASAASFRTYPFAPAANASHVGGVVLHREDEHVRAR